MTRFLFLKTGLLALVASSTLATQLPTPLQVREDIEPGSPLYNCHEACGEVILMSENANYCDNSTFTSYLESCLECAKTYDIWKYYGTEVKSAASNCSDDATPSPSSATTGGVGATATASGNGSSSANSSTTAVITTTGTTSGTAATASSTNGVISFIQHDAVLPVIMGVLAWAITA